MGGVKNLRHLAFFEEIAKREEHEPEWRTATAGLVVLRLVDAWLEDGARAVVRDAWGVRAVRGAIDEVDEGTPIRAILTSIVDAMQASKKAQPHEVMPRLMAYARALEYNAQWTLAADVYECVLGCTHPTEESDTVIMAQLQYGVCLRTLSRFDEAQVAYATAGVIANQVGDMMGVLRAKIGDAAVVMMRGNLPHADTAFASIAEQAAALGEFEPQAMALNSRAALAGLRGDYELTIQFAYDALQISSSTGIERDRILSNIGTAFHRLGIRSAARDTFLILSTTAQEQYTRWSAMLSLMTIAAEDGSEPSFEQFRRTLSSAPMPPELQADYFIHLARGYRELDQEELAQIALHKAVELAGRNGLNRHLFEAEEALKTVPARRTPTPDQIPNSVAGVADAIRNMRELVLAET